jgi:hypothetical protein
MVNDTVSKIRALGQPKDLSIKDGEAEYKFNVKPLSARILALANTRGETIDMDSKDDLAIFAKKLYPMMEVVFPACCIVPKVSLEETKDEDTIWIEEIPMSVSSKLLEEILHISGLKEDKKGDKEESVKN